MSAAPVLDVADAFGIPRVPWDEFVALMDWQQGEHVSLIGPTGQGKTTLALDLLRRKRSYNVLLAAKPKDRTLDGLRRQGWQMARSWPPPRSRAPLTASGAPQFHRVLLWPKFARLTDARHQAEVFRHALHEIFGAGGWCVFADDLNYLMKLGLREEFEAMWYQGRSIGLSLVASVQRPAWVPLLVYSQATHLFFWHTNDARDLKTISGLNGANDRTVKAVVEALPKHDVLYVNSRTGEQAITRVRR